MDNSETWVLDIELSGGCATGRFRNRHAPIAGPIDVCLYLCFIGTFEVGAAILCCRLLRCLGDAQKRSVRLSINPSRFYQPEMDR